MKLRLYKSKKVIYGCEAAGQAGSPYLTRYVLHQANSGAELKLHYFHRSDDEIQHNHPWNFWSIILWPGYWEVTPTGIRRRWPLIPAYRPAVWRHQVVLFTATCPNCSGSGFDWLGWNDECGFCHGFRRVERPCWTLIWTGPKFRRWGFFTKEGFRDWMDYFRERGC